MKLHKWRLLLAYFSPNICRFDCGNDPLTSAVFKRYWRLLNHMSGIWTYLQTDTTAYTSNTIKQWSLFHTFQDHRWLFTSPTIQGKKPDGRSSKYIYSGINIYSKYMARLTFFAPFSRRSQSYSHSSVSFFLLSSSCLFKTPLCHDK